MERHDGRIGSQRHPLCPTYRRKRRQVGHFHLRIGNDLKENETCAVIDSRLDRSRVGHLRKTGFDPEIGQRRSQQRIGIAEQMGRSHHIAAGPGHRHQQVGDGCHTGVESRDTQRTGHLPDALFEILHRRIGDARIGMIGRTPRKCQFHRFGRRKFVGGILIERHIQRPVGIRFGTARGEHLGRKSSFILVHFPDYLENANVNIFKTIFQTQSTLATYLFYSRHTSVLHPLYFSHLIATITNHCVPG